MASPPGVGGLLRNSSNQLRSKPISFAGNAETAKLYRLVNGLRSFDRLFYAGWGPRGERTALKAPLDRSSPARGVF